MSVTCTLFDESWSIASGHVTAVCAPAHAWGLLKPQLSDVSWALASEQLVFPPHTTVSHWLFCYGHMRGVSRRDMQRRVPFLCRYFLLNEHSQLGQLSDKQSWLLGCVMGLLVQPQLMVLQQTTCLPDEDRGKLARLIQQLLPAMAWWVIGPEHTWLPGLSVNRHIEWSAACTI